ncbi:MAG: SGNH/GDSL hydrolase family protein [Cytophagia bacterium]|nr:MAG: SGNH/GDSL hydrolase family protein [Cytophagia bacterium]TAG42545.1 MAG: SGNH/GDSL hydrolase family protein [Cytophagia bacterium]
MKKIFHFVIALSLTSIFTACYQDPRKVDPIIPAPVIARGTADFTRYIAVGNSLTAGFADGGLYNAGIAGSYPNLLAAQFRLAGGGNFVQPLFLDNASNGTPYRKQVGLPSATNTPRLFDVVASDANCGVGNSRLVSSPSVYNPTAAPLLQPYTGPPLNNLGVPGIRVSHSKVSSFGRDRAFGPNVFFNNYYERMLNSSNRDISYEDYVAAQAANATFFTCWLGNNDVLSYATAGAPDLPNFLNDMTDITTFTTNFQAMMTVLLANGRKGVVVTIPYVDKAPFFTTVTLAAFQARIQAGGGPANAPIWIQAQSGVRQATADDLFLLTSQGYYAGLYNPTTGLGASSANPITDENVLDRDEVIAIKTRTDAFNAVITAYNSNPNVAVVNINTSVLDALSSPAGFPSFGVTYRSTYLQGGAFSTDGIHLSPAGYAVVANEIIKATNTKFTSAIPLINTSTFVGLRIYNFLCESPR